MADITRDVLEQEIAALEAQKAEFVGKANQAAGAITLARHLLSKLHEPAAPLAFPVSVDDPREAEGS